MNGLPLDNVANFNQKMNEVWLVDNTNFNQTAFNRLKSWWEHESRRDYCGFCERNQNGIIIFYIGETKPVINKEDETITIHGTYALATSNGNWYERDTVAKTILYNGRNYWTCLDNFNGKSELEIAIDEFRELSTNMATSIRTRDNSQEEINAQDIPNEIRKYKDLSPVSKQYWDVRTYLTDISQLLLPTGDRVIDEKAKDAQGNTWKHKVHIEFTSGYRDHATTNVTFFSNYRFCFSREWMSTQSDTNLPVCFLLTCCKNASTGDIVMGYVGTSSYSYNCNISADSSHGFGPTTATDMNPIRGYQYNSQKFSGNWAVNFREMDLNKIGLPIFNTNAEAYEYCRQEVTPTTIKPSSFPARILSVNKKQYLALNKKLYYHWMHFISDETSYAYAFTCDIYYDYPIVAYCNSNSTSDIHYYDLLTIYPGNNGGWYFAHVTMSYNSYDGYINSSTRFDQHIGDSNVQSGFNKIVSTVWKNSKPYQSSDLDMTYNATIRSGIKIMSIRDGDTHQDVFEYLVYQQTGMYAAPNGRFYKYKYTIYGDNTYQGFVTDADWYTNFPIGCYNNLEYANLSYLGDVWTGDSVAGSQTKCLMNLRNRNPGTYTDPLPETYCIIYYPGQPNNQALDVCVVVRGGEDGYTLHPYPSNNYPVYTKNTFPNFNTEAELIEYLNS